MGRNLRDSLAYAGHEVELVTTGEEGLDRAVATDPDLILLDLMLPHMNGMDVLRGLRADQSARGDHVSSPVVMMTAYGDIETAVTAMKNGAEDFVIKSGGLGELSVVVERALKRRSLEDNLNYFRNRERAGSVLDSIVGTSASMERIKSKVRRLVSGPAAASSSPPTVLITGETGTGKDMIARAIHYEGPRESEAFVYVNCTAIPSELFESELFGHVKGAFTDARGSKKGLFEVAHRGTIFLDEIGHLILPLQAKLLAAIDNRTIRPVGATVERRVDTQVIAASNRDMEAAIRSGDFRQDLYHRLRVVTFEVPPLRERVEDIEPLALHFVAQHAQRSAIHIRGITPEAMALLEAHDWPGNVRELSHMIESVVLMIDDDTIRPEHLPLQTGNKPGGVGIRLADESVIDVDFARGTPTLDEVQNQIINAALVYARHNVSRAARILGISRDALRYRIEKQSANRDAKG